MPLRTPSVAAQHTVRLYWIVVTTVLYGTYEMQMHILLMHRPAKASSVTLTSLSSLHAPTDSAKMEDLAARHICSPRASV